MNLLLARHKAGIAVDMHGGQFGAVARTSRAIGWLVVVCAFLRLLLR
jgi:hypothetical protein